MITPALKAALLEHDWPGNVRELKARAERFALGLDEPPAASGKEPRFSGGTLPERLAAFERSEIRTAMEACDNRSAVAAQRLGIPRRTLNEKLSRFGIRQN